MTERSFSGFRELPHNLDAERAILGAILVNNRHYEAVKDRLRPKHFYEPSHAACFHDIESEYTNGRHFDWITFGHGHDQKALEALANLGSIMLAEDVEGYASTLIDLAKRRALINIAEETRNRAYDLSLPEDAAGHIEIVRQHLEGLARETPRAFSFVDHADIAEQLPLRPFLVDRWVPEGCLTSLYGSGGAGKSFLALMMAMCVAAGREWLGFPCQKATVLAIMCEDDKDEIRRRRNRIARAIHMSREDIEDRLFLVSRVGELNAMMEFPQGVATRTQFLADTIAEAKRLQARLIILDNAAQLFGGNENDRSQVTAFLNALAGIAIKIDGAVLLLGHPPKTANVEFSGSTAWDAVSRSRMWFKRVEEDEDDAESCIYDRYTLELVKSNYAKRFGIELQENGQGIAECVGELEKTRKTRRTNADRTLDALRAMFTTHRRAISLDELVAECIRRGIVAEADEETAGWRDRRRTVRAHLARFPAEVEDRGSDTFAIKP